MKKNRVSIIIPAHNEEKRIRKTLVSYASFFIKKTRNKEIKNFEIVVVLNACIDNTLWIVKKNKRRYKQIRYLNFKQGGKGFAITEGFKDALKRDSDLIGFVDADFSTIPEDFFDLVKNISQHDGIIASRWLKNSKIKTKQTFLRRFVSRGFNFLVRILFLLPYKDTQCGAKLFKKKCIEKVIPKLKSTKWAFDVDLIYQVRKNGFKIREIPTVWKDSEGSKINIIKTPFQMFAAIVRLRLLYSPFKFIVSIYDKLPEKMKIHH